jgi:hypothetical protein
MRSIVCTLRVLGEFSLRTLRLMHLTFSGYFDFPRPGHLHQLRNNQTIYGVACIQINFANYLVAFLFQFRNTSLVQFVTVRRNKEIVDRSILESVLTSLQHLQFKPLDIAVQNVESFDPVFFHQIVY